MMFQIKKIVILYTFLIFSINLVAQEESSYLTVDKETYSQYLQANWKELIKTGKLSLKNEVDFYYLQVRMGIAYYELKKYRNAIPYFENARKQNTENELVNEYLYYSYLFSGRSFDARKLSGTFTDKLKTKLGIKVKPIISALNIDLRQEEIENHKAETTLGELHSILRILSVAIGPFPSRGPPRALTTRPRRASPTGTEITRPVDLTVCPSFILRVSPSSTAPTESSSRLSAIP